VGSSADMIDPAVVAPARGRSAPGRLLAAVALLVMVMLAPPRLAAETPWFAEPPTRISVQSQPIAALDPRDPGQQRFGQLEFRGGLVLSSSYKEFGGISAIRIAPDGATFIALSDQGRWLRGRIIYEGQQPSGIVAAEMAPILGADGQPLAARGWFDTESIAEDGGTLYVGIERVNQIVRFNYGRDGLLARGQPIAVPPAIRTLPYNKGLEALVFVPKGMPLAGTLVAISERGLDRAGNLRGFLIGGPAPGAFTVKRRDGFDVSDAALLPAGDMLLLERRFNWSTGLSVRIRRIALAAFAPGALVDGAVLFEADLGYQIDNMEALSVHRDAAGEIVLTLMSDDNFSPLQRTLLLQFTLAEP
jgi:hypothetical protein